MARSFQGGTRGFLRGKVASDLYQVTKDESGKRIQLVRAVESSRQNNNTVEQALARMRMAAIMRALAKLKVIVDHSWETVPYGQLSIAHFTKINMPLLNWDVYNNWAQESFFAMPGKGVTSFGFGAYIVADGSLPYPSFIKCPDARGAYGIVSFEIELPRQGSTMLDLKYLMGLSSNDYITIMLFAGSETGLSSYHNTEFYFVRLYLNPDMPNDTVISIENAGSCFTYEGNCAYSVVYRYYQKKIQIGIDVSADGINRHGVAYALVSSRWDGIKWCRCRSQFRDQNGLLQQDWGDGMPRYAFETWFSEWKVDEGFGKYDYDEYPAPAPNNMQPVI